MQVSPALRRALPFLRWLHRFQRPMGLPYANRWEDRIRNYMIGLGELGQPTQPAEEHFIQLLGKHVAGPMIEAIRYELDTSGLSAAADAAKAVSMSAPSPTRSDSAS